MVTMLDTGVPTVPSSVPIADASVYTTPSSVLATAGATPSRRRTRLRFMSSTQTVGYDVERRSPIREGIGRQRDKAADPVPHPHPEDAAVLPHVQHEVPSP
ncbi:hypothetical protein LWI28_009238 [Acer negundo]|uniref:Uncharacterized protein n=1 Tax=Acer negundo TaxID=4023 RepID=A0AAD5ID87_ACENE|nr:hypothetical protein LWI28_009238 [Acer negundo]